MIHENCFSVCNNNIYLAIYSSQTDKKPNKSKRSYVFDNCNITKLFLNSQYFPYDSFNLKFDKDKYSVLYEIFANIRQSYYNTTIDPLV